MTKAKLGQVQLQIMQVLWRLGRASARQLTEELDKESPTARSTVQTLLRQMESKGFVAFEQVDRTFMFYPLVDQDEYKASATKSLLQSVFDGNGSSLVLHLLEHEKISAKELAEIKKTIDRKRKR